MNMTRRLAIAMTFGAMALSGPAALSAHEFKVGTIKIEHPWSRVSPMKSDVNAGFVTITNTGTEDDRLIKATAEITSNVQLHDMKMEGDVMKMVELTDGITIPAGKTVELKPRSLHIMFLDLKSQPTEGTMFKGSLTFEKAGEVQIEYMVEAPK